MAARIFCGNRNLLIKLFLFIVGFIIGVFIFDNVFVQSKSLKHQKEVYNDVLANKLFREVKIMCLIMTNPNNHRIKAIHVRDTWGKKCDKLKFITTQEDPELDSIVVKVANDTRKALRRKVKTAVLYTYDKYGDEFDWFIKADDDNYVIMENLRYLLYQYKPTTSFFFGHKQIEIKFTENAFYMSGAGYILSKKALEKLAKKLRADPFAYFYPDEEREDIEMGRALEGSAIFVDCRDELQRRRFLPFTFVLNGKFPPWYERMTYFKAPPGAVSCCSDVPVALHYINGSRQYLNEYLVYHVHPFGLDKNSTETLPRKLPLNEIIAASNVKSTAKFYKDHKTVLDLESSERY